MILNGFFSGLRILLLLTGNLLRKLYLWVGHHFSPEYSLYDSFIYHLAQLNFLELLRGKYILHSVIFLLWFSVCIYWCFNFIFLSIFRSFWLFLGSYVFVCIQTYTICWCIQIPMNLKKPKQPIIWNRRIEGVAF